DAVQPAGGDDPADGAEPARAQGLQPGTQGGARLAARRLQQLRRRDAEGLPAAAQGGPRREARQPGAVERAFGGRPGPARDRVGPAGYQGGNDGGGGRGGGALGRGGGGGGAERAGGAGPGPHPT